MRTLVVGNQSFNYPDQGEDPIWGENSTEWAVAITDAIADLQTTGDIAQTSASIANNQSSPATIAALLLDTSNVRSAEISYAIYRISTSNPSGNAESGVIYAIYDDSASSGNKWQISQEYTGNAGVVFSIADNGQFSYTSTDIGSLGYSGIIKFRSRSLNP